MSERIEEIKSMRQVCMKDKKKYCESILVDDLDYLLRIAEMAIMTRNMLKVCIGRPVDDTATIFLDKALESKE